MAPDDASRARQTSHRRSARARREQRQRAAARLVCGVLNASTRLAVHRGCAPGRHLAELASLLGGKPLGMPEDDVPQEASAVESSTVYKPRPMASAKPMPVPARPGQAALGAVQRLVQLFEDGGRAAKPQKPQVTTPHLSPIEEEDEDLLDDDMPPDAFLEEDGGRAPHQSPIEDEDEDDMLPEAFLEEDGGRAAKPQNPQVTTPHQSIEDEDEDMLEDEDEDMLNGLPLEVFLEEDGGRAAKPQKPHPTTPRQSPIEDEDDSRLDDQAFEAFLREADARTAEREASLAAWDAAGTG